MTLAIEVGGHRIVSREGMREAQLLKLRSGDLLLTYHVQADMHFSERKGLRSSNGGRTWRPDPQRGHREQAIGEGAHGVVLAFDIHTFERRPGEFIGSYFKSDDGGATFTGPHETVVFVNRVACLEYPTPEHIPPEDHVLRKFYQPLPSYYEPIVQSSSRRMGPIFWRYVIEHEGRWLAPMPCRFHGDRVERTILTASEDGGKTWNFAGTIGYDEEPWDGLCEPVLLATPDGGVLCVMRRGSGQPLGQCRSYDGGRTWSKRELLAAHGVDPDLCFMSNGVLACTFGRPGLHIMFSEDGCGFSWGYRTEIGDWPSSCYMGIAEVAPGELLLIYDRCESPEVGRDPKKCLIGSTTVRVQSKNARRSTSA